MRNRGRIVGILTLGCLASACATEPQLGFVSPPSIRDDLRGSFSTAGIVRSDGAGGPTLLEEASNWVAGHLDVRAIHESMSDDERRLLLAPPAVLAARGEELDELRERSVERFVLVGRVRQEPVDHYRRVHGFFPLIRSFVVAIDRERLEMPREVLSMRVVDLESGRIVASGLHIATGVPEARELGKRRIKSVLGSMGLSAWRLRS